MSKLLKKTIRLLCMYDMYGNGLKHKTAGRNFERIARAIENMPQGYYYNSAFASVGRHLRRAMRNDLNG